MMMNEKLRTIENLKWLPYIGDQYMKIDENYKMIVIGESHYHDNSEQSILKHNNEYYTRIVIKELAIERQYWGTKIFQNFHKTIFTNDIFSTSKFWNLVSYYNFIQRPMVTNKSRPDGKDFYESWKPFFEIVKILKPKICLFIGTSAANSLSNAIKNSDFKTNGVKWEEKINRAYAKTAIITDKENNEIKLIFIRHTSQMYSWQKWNLYLEKVMNNQLSWLKEQVV